MHRLLLAIPALSLLSASPALAGMRWTMEYATGRDAPMRVTFATEGTKLRMEGPPGTAGRATHVLIADAATRQLLVLDPAQKSYVDVLAPPPAPIDAAKIPADMKAKPPATTPALQFTGTGRKDKVGAATCEIHAVRDGARVIEEACLVPWGKGAPTRDEQAALDKLRAALPDSSETGAPDVSLTSYPGYPVRRRHLGPQGAVLSTETMTGFQRVAIPAADLAIPPSYTLARRAR